MSIVKVLPEKANWLAQMDSPVQPDATDVTWFTAQLKPPVAAPMNAQPTLPIGSAVSRLNDSADIAARSLRKVVSSIDPQQAMQANRSLSSFYLESLLSAKLVAKAVQGVEKLTTLQ